MSDLALWLSEAQKRKELSKQTSSYRVIHKSKTPLRADKMGDVLCGMWFSPLPPKPNELADFSKLAENVGCKHTFMRAMLNRGADPNTQLTWKSESCPEEWTAKEYELSFLMKTSEGTSPGLFLDQREARNRVFRTANKKRVLNLFSYTGGFSVAAARGGATEVTTVDLSPKYIEWSKQNFALNDKDPKEYEFWAADARVYLKGAAKRGRVFDIIICDPPSFSRTKDGLFRVEKDIVGVLDTCKSIIAHDGVLFFSTNFEGWDRKEFLRLTSYWGWKPEWFGPPADFEFGGQDTELKSAFLLPQ